MSKKFDFEYKASLSELAVSPMKQDMNASLKKEIKEIKFILGNTFDVFLKGARLQIKDLADNPPAIFKYF